MKLILRPNWFSNGQMSPPANWALKATILQNWDGSAGFAPARLGATRETLSSLYKRKGHSMASNLKGLIGKLNDSTRSALEAAAGFCLTRTHYDIEIEHFLMKLLEVTDSDLQHILKHFAVNKSHLASDLTISLDKLKTGNARTPVFSPSLVQMLSEAWTIGSLDFGAAQRRWRRPATSEKRNHPLAGSCSSPGRCRDQGRI